MTPAPKIKPTFHRWIGTEDDFQMSVAALMDEHTHNWFHVANERKTKTYTRANGSKWNPEGARLKAKGVKSGIPDVMCLDKINGWEGLAIELKVHPNKATDNQKQWLDKLAKLGWGVWVSDSREEGEQIVKQNVKPNHAANPLKQQGHGC